METALWINNEDASVSIIWQTSQHNEVERIFQSVSEALNFAKDNNFDLSSSRFFSSQNANRFHRTDVEKFDTI